MDGSYRVDLLTYRQVSERLADRAAVILPLGGCEPFGAVGRIGAETLCAEWVSEELSERCRVVSAPPMPFGCSTPFISFPGAAGVKPRTFVNMLCEIIHAYALQGAARVFLINAAPFNKTPATEAAKRIKAKYGGVKVLLFDINTIVRTVGIDVDTVNNAVNTVDTVSTVDTVDTINTINTTNTVNTVNTIDRADIALLAMAAYLEQANVDTSGIDTNVNASGINTSGINTSGINTSGINTSGINTSGINTSGINTLGVNTTSINTSGVNANNKRKSVNVDQYRSWKKRGADPQKLRKLFPDGLLLPPDGGVSTVDITPERGKQLFNRVVELIRRQIEEAL